MADKVTRTNSVERVLRMFRTMLTIREFEEAAYRCQQEGLVRGPVHQSIGQEAVAVGICSNLRIDDLIHSNHRGHGHSIAKGADPVSMMKELHGKVGGTSGGKGGSMHIADFSVGMLGANGILADGVPMGVGAAHAIALKGEGTVVTVFVGDGASNRGPFYESLNWAKVFNLPLVIVCEDNEFGQTTRTSTVTAGLGPAARVASFDVPVISVDGNDLVAVDAAAGEVVERARRGHGPQFIHARTYRLAGHITSDNRAYRSAEEEAERWKHEPIARCEAWLKDLRVSREELLEIRGDVKKVIDAAVDAAKAAPIPHPSAAFEDVQDIGAPVYTA